MVKDADYKGHGNKYPNGKRTTRQRRVRYCFLRQLGLSRDQVRAIVGRTDSNLVKTLDSIHIRDLRGRFD